MNGEPWPLSNDLRGLPSFYAHRWHRPEPAAYGLTRAELLEWHRRYDRMDATEAPTVAPATATTEATR